MTDVAATERLIIQTRIGLLRNPKVSWLVTLLLSAITRVSTVTDCGHKVDTMCVDATHFYINPNFFNALEPEYRPSSFIHEALHLGLKHVARYIDFPNHDKYNRACDYIVNYMVKRLGFPIHADWLYDPKYDMWSLLNIYNDLPDEAGDNKQLANCMYKPASQDELAEVNSRVYSAEQILKGNPGALSAISALFEEFTAANTDPLPFKTILSDYLNELTKEDPTWRHLNRRLFASGLMMKGYGFGSLRSAVVAFDSSGSMSDEQKNITIEQIEFMRDVLNVQELYLIVFDDKIQNAMKIDQGTPITTFDLNGGGGTDLVPVYDFIKEKQLEPELLMVFTDMALYLPPKPDYPVLWVGIHPVHYWVERFKNDPTSYGTYAELM